MAVLDTRANMLEGFVRQRSYSLGKASSEVLRETAALGAMLDALSLVADVKATYLNEISRLRDVATHYFEAAGGLDSEPTPQVVVSTAVPGSTLNDPFELRKCPPPVFTGNVREYMQWWEHFESAVHHNKTLENKYRIIHLLASVKGEAKEFLRGYQATGENYQKALDALKARFGDKTKLAQSFFSDLAALPDLANLKEGDVTVSEDRTNLDKIKVIVLGLRSTGNYDTELTQGWVLRKISRHRTREVFVFLSKDYPRSIVESN